jgi:hypothetical protein
VTGVRERGTALLSFARRHQAIFWTLHSIWALSWGVVFMVIGTKRTWLLRYGLISIGAVWLTSLLLPALLRRTWLPEPRRDAARRVVLYGQKWLLQGLAFFILPLYHRSATYPSRNTLFMALLVAAAVAATIDALYDEVVTKRPFVLGVFLAFLTFAYVNLMLPMVWRVGGLWNLSASAILATAVFASFHIRTASNAGPGLLKSTGVALLFGLLVTIGRPLVPPAPLRLVTTTFGTELAEEGLAIALPLTSLPPATETRLHAVAAILAPAGLAEGVRHVWSVDGARVAQSRLIPVIGGRATGFRSQSSATLRGLAPGQLVRLEVETAWGQLIGRVAIDVR